MAATDIADRELAWEGCWNARDLGGLPIEGGLVPEGALARSDALSRMSETGWAALREHGVRTVIDLRASGEAERDPDRVPTGVAYRHVPIIDVVHDAEKRAFRELPRWDRAYELMVDRFRPGFATAVQTIADAGPGGVAVHCRVGRDRTGILVGLLLAAAGTPREAILEDYALSAERLARAFEQWIAGEPDPRRRAQLEWESSPPADLVLHALDHVAVRYGGPEAYLAGAGADVARAVARLQP
jgi:protein-tyrosine phosphatase